MLSDKFEAFKTKELAENRELRSKVEDQKQMIKMLQSQLNSNAAAIKGNFSHKEIFYKASL